MLRGPSVIPNKREENCSCCNFSSVQEVREALVSRYQLKFPLDHQEGRKKEQLAAVSLHLSDLSPDTQRKRGRRKTIPNLVALLKALLLLVPRSV